MSLKCLFGHNWNDSCKCVRCGATRDGYHSFEPAGDRCVTICKICGQEKPFHSWKGCKCERCGATRDEEHQFEPATDRCVTVCKICGKEKNLDHRWKGCKCERCGATRNEAHQYNKENVCTVCGKKKGFVVGEYYTKSDITTLHVALGMVKLVAKDTADLYSSILELEKIMEEVKREQDASRTPQIEMDTSKLVTLIAMMELWKVAIPKIWSDENDKEKCVRLILDATSISNMTMCYMYHLDNLGKEVDYPSLSNSEKYLLLKVFDMLSIPEAVCKYREYLERVKKIAAESPKKIKEADLFMIRSCIDFALESYFRHAHYSGVNELCELKKKFE